MRDTSHLIAIHERLSHYRAYLANAGNDRARDHFQRCIAQTQKEMDAELKFLGMPTFDEFDQISDEELLKGLQSGGE